MDSPTVCGVSSPLCYVSFSSSYIPQMDEAEDEDYSICDNVGRVFWVLVLGDVIPKYTH